MGRKDETSKNEAKVNKDKLYINIMNCKIYKIYCNHDVYIGYTSKDLNERLNRHYRHYKSYKEGKMNFISVFFIFDKYDKKDIKIECIEEFNIITKKDALQKESYYLQTINCVNKYKNHTKEENNKKWHIENIERARELDRKWKEQNRDKINERQRERRLNAKKTK